MIEMTMRIPLLVINSLQDWTASVELYFYWPEEKFSEIFFGDLLRHIHLRKPYYRPPTDIGTDARSG